MDGIPGNASKGTAVRRPEGLGSIGAAATGVLMLLFGMASTPSIAAITQDGSTVGQHADPAGYDTDGNPKWH
jgi:hypothetical protein